MKKIKLSVIIFLCSLNVLCAQEPNKKFKFHNFWVLKIDNSKVIKGILSEANDESLIIIGKKNTKIIVNVIEIHEIKIRRQGKVGKGAAIGAGTGVATGLLIGYASGDDPDETADLGFLGTWTIHGTTAGEKAASWAFGLGIAGTVVGAVVSMKKETFLIKGDSKNYLMHLDEIQSYSLNQKK